jgi:PleD family two-component response regulator
MKYLILLLLSFNSYAGSMPCTPWIPLTRAEAIAAITDKEQLKEIPMKLCKDFPDEECICSEGNVRASKIETRFYEDANGINQPYKVLVKDDAKAAAFELAESLEEAEIEAENLEKKNSHKELKKIKMSDINNAATLDDIKDILKHLVKACRQ